MMKTEKNLRRSLLITLTVACWALTSCGGYSVTGGPGRVVNPPLLGEVVAPEKLAVVSTVAILPVQSKPELLLSEGLEEVMSQELVFTMAEELGFEVEPDPQKADAVLTTMITHYEERVGSRVGVETAARVGFSMKLLSTANRGEIWRASFHFRDQALSENIFRIRERIGKKGQKGWVTAREILRRGFRSARDDISTERLRLLSIASS